MGCGSSTAALSGTQPKPTVPSALSLALERQLVSAIVATKRRKSFKVKKSSFNGLMLQLPKLKNGFKRVRDGYKQLEQQGTNNRVPWGLFKRHIQLVGLDPNSISVKEIVSMPDVDDSIIVAAQDLTVIFTVVYLLDANKKNSISYPEVKHALEIMEKTFIFFDSSSTGCIERKELALAMKSGTRVFGRKASKSLADRLFDQLDWDGSGRITFKEFLVGMEQIIMEDFDDSDEECDDDDDNELQALEDWADEGEDDEGLGAAGGRQVNGAGHGGGLPKHQGRSGGEDGQKDGGGDGEEATDAVQPFQP